MERFAASRAPGPGWGYEAGARVALAEMRREFGGVSFARGPSYQRAASLSSTVWTALSLAGSRRTVSTRRSRPPDPDPGAAPARRQPNPSAMRCSAPAAPAVSRRAARRSNSESRGSDGGPAPRGGPVREGSGAFSASTERARRSDLAVYAAWCAGRGLRALPAAPGTLAAFVDAMAELRAPATVRRYLASVAAAHREAGWGEAGWGEAGQSEAVRLALRRMHRGKGRRQDQARGLTWPLRNRLLAAPGGRAIDERNRALLAVAYDTLLRRAELVSVQVADLLAETGGDATLLVRRSKTDPEGAGAVVWLAPDSVGLVRAWLVRSGVRDGALFRSVDKGGRVGGPLPPGQVARIFKAMARAAGLPAAAVDGLSGHSTRVGAAQDMIAAGIELPSILQAGRWKSTAMVNRYGERLLARRSGAARLARLQGRA